MKYINNFFNNLNILKYIPLVFISMMIVGGCTEDAENFQSSNPVNTAIVSITPDFPFGNVCGINDIVVDAELIPDGSGFSIEILEDESNVSACLIGSDFTVENKKATASFINNYVVGVGAVGSVRVFIRITPVNGAPFQIFEDINIAGIGIIPPTPGMGENFVIEIDPENPPGPLALLFDTAGLANKGLIAELSLADDGLGSISSDMIPVSSDGTFFVIYSPANVAGIQILSASITLITDPQLKELCPLVADGATVSVNVIIEQVASGM